MQQCIRVQPGREMRMRAEQYEIRKVLVSDSTFEPDIEAGWEPFGVIHRPASGGTYVWLKRVIQSRKAPSLKREKME